MILTLGVIQPRLGWVDRWRENGFQAETAAQAQVWLHHSEETDLTSRAGLKNGNLKRFGLISGDTEGRSRCLWKARWSRMSFSSEVPSGKPLEAWMEESWWEWHFGKSIWAVRCRHCFVCFYTIDVVNFGAVQSVIFLSLVILLSYLRNHCLTQSQENLFSFSSKSFTAITLSFRSVIHLDFIFTYGVR